MNTHHAFILDKIEKISWCNEKHSFARTTPVRLDHIKLFEPLQFDCNAVARQESQHSTCLNRILTRARRFPNVRYSNIQMSCPLWDCR